MCSCILLCFVFFLQSDILSLLTGKFCWFFVVLICVCLFVLAERVFFTVCRLSLVLVNRGCSLVVTFVAKHGP